jgi:hypothetical protein
MLCYEAEQPLQHLSSKSPSQELSERTKSERGPSLSPVIELLYHSNQLIPRVRGIPTIKETAQRYRAMFKLFEEHMEKVIRSTDRSLKPWLLAGFLISSLSIRLTGRNSDVLPGLSWATTLETVSAYLAVESLKSIASHFVDWALRRTKEGLRRDVVLYITSISMFENTRGTSATAKFVVSFGLAFLNLAPNLMVQFGSSTSATYTDRNHQNTMVQKGSTGGWDGQGSTMTGFNYLYSELADQRAEGVSYTAYSGPMLWTPVIPQIGYFRMRDGVRGNESGIVEENLGTLSVVGAGDRNGSLEFEDTFDGNRQADIKINCYKAGVVWSVFYMTRPSYAGADSLYHDGNFTIRMARTKTEYLTEEGKTKVVVSDWNKIRLLNQDLPIDFKTSGDRTMLALVANLVSFRVDRSKRDELFVVDNKLDRTLAGAMSIRTSNENNTLGSKHSATDVIPATTFIKVKSSKAAQWYLISIYFTFALISLAAMLANSDAELFSGDILQTISLFADHAKVRFASCAPGWQMSEATAEAAQWGRTKVRLAFEIPGSRPYQTRVPPIMLGEMNQYNVVSQAAWPAGNVANMGHVQSIAHLVLVTKDDVVRQDPEWVESTEQFSLIFRKNGMAAVPPNIASAMNKFIFLVTSLLCCVTAFSIGVIWVVASAIAWPVAVLARLVKSGLETAFKPKYYNGDLKDGIVKIKNPSLRRKYAVVERNIAELWETPEFLIGSSEARQNLLCESYLCEEVACSKQKVK